MRDFTSQMLSYGRLPVPVQHELYERHAGYRMRLAKNPHIDESTVLLALRDKKVRADLAEALVSAHPTDAVAARLVERREKRVGVLGKFCRGVRSADALAHVATHLPIPPEGVTRLMSFDNVDVEVKLIHAGSLKKVAAAKWALTEPQLTPSQVFDWVEQAQELRADTVAAALMARPELVDEAAARGYRCTLAALATVTPPAPVRRIVFEQLRKTYVDDAELPSYSAKRTLTDVTMYVMCDDPQLTSDEYDELMSLHESRNSVSRKMPQFRGVGRDYEQMSDSELDEVVGKPVDVARATPQMSNDPGRLFQIEALLARRELHDDAALTLLSNLATRSPDDMHHAGRTRKIVRQLTGYERPRESTGRPPRKSPPPAADFDLRVESIHSKPSALAATAALVERLGDDRAAWSAVVELVEAGFEGTVATLADTADVTMQAA